MPESKVVSVRIDLDFLERVNATADRLYAKSYTGQPNRSQLFLDSLKLFCELAEMGKFDNINMRSLSADSIVNSVDDRVNNNNEELAEAIKQKLLPEIVELLKSSERSLGNNNLTNEPVSSTVNSVDNRDTMTVTQAWQLALSRGFAGTKKSFSNAFTRSRHSDYRSHGIGRIPQGKGKPALYFDDEK